MKIDNLFTVDYKTTPYWWDAMEVWQPPGVRLPEKAEVVIIGAGLTGSSAAASLARAGKDVVVVDAQYPGFGASARNAGFLSRHFKHSLTDLLKKMQPSQAAQYFHTLQTAYDHTLAMIRSEKLDCGFQEHGRFIAAMNEPDFDVLKREYALRKQYLNEAFEIVEDGGKREYRSSHVVGGVLLQDQASIHPGLYVQAMAKRALASGAQIFCYTKVDTVQTADTGFHVRTAQGSIYAKDVIIATNAFTDNGVKWTKRGLIPIRGYQIATEPLDADLLRELLPFSRTYTDRRNASNYLRPSPDGTRLLFGGQTGTLMEDHLEEVALKVRNEMVELFPQLQNTRLSHVWSGRCAAAIDLFPKIGQRNGMYYALAYCFSGNVLAPYFGHQLAQRILGKQTAENPFAERPFRTIPFYNGNAWFVPMVQKYHAFLDKLRA